MDTFQVMSYPLLVEIYDYLLMTNKHKLIMSYNEESLNNILKYDIEKRYKSWKVNKPTLIYFIRHTAKEEYIIHLINTYELLCHPPQIKKHENALYNACLYKLDKVAIKMIRTYGLLCEPKYISQDDETHLIMAC